VKFRVLAAAAARERRTELVGRVPDLTGLAGLAAGLAAGGSAIGLDHQIGRVPRRRRRGFDAG
jgi:hypothetical protein